LADTGNDKLAVLIDADNAQASVINELLEEVSRYGTASIKRAYGDWTTGHLKGWKTILLQTAIQPIQQFAYTQGKNATDSALIIDAMDLLHAGNLDGFCIVSSDSDFTRLATRLREAGLKVYGFGERKTPDPFVKACDKFVYSEILKPQRQKSKSKENEPEPLRPILKPAITATADDDGWAELSAVGSMIAKTSPSFDPRNYGYQKLGELVRAQSFLKVKEAPSVSPGGHVRLHVRWKGR
jgi:uncharacterized LabA/DUF88 family protein